MEKMGMPKMPMPDHMTLEEMEAMKRSMETMNDKQKAACEERMSGMKGVKR